ncbi:choline-sulfatase [Vallitalea longa]|uniref:Choline-sulfatase n=1 Tax=Vallitalea longa TaxID=2936439 RepID=A0A9W5YFA1_9FIRM|nr:sulfatase-like hydrolase/transferase [Vallitalea longa]GKX31445.1 choline-sulfatase [Vallitalea longa]
MSKTNVVVIMADQLRADMLGEDTPNITQIANEGVKFNRAYCASPLCVPARGAFFTGKYPNINGSLINPWFSLDAHHGDVNKDVPNLYRMMEREWDSWHAGKQHLYTEGGKMENDPNSKTNWIATSATYDKYLKDHNKQRPGGPNFRGRVAEMTLGKFTRVKDYSIPKTGCYKEGFDTFFDGYFANSAVKAIRKRDKSKPLLLNAMFLAPHPPLDIPEPWYSMYKEVDVPENVGKWNADQSPLQMYNLTGILGSRYTREDWKDIWPVYKGLVSLLDHCVGMIIDELKVQGIYDETLIIFTSDHGEMLGSHSLWQKMCMYEESVRIPLLMKFPSGVDCKGKEIDEVVSAVDVLPTLCEYLKIEPPKDLSGVSLMTAIAEEPIDREMIYIQFDGNGARGNFQRCAIMENYKLIIDIFKDEVFLELYDLGEDVGEQNNLIFEKKYRSIIINMVDRIREHMKNTEDMLEVSANVYEDFLENYSQLRVK